MTDASDSIGQLQDALALLQQGKLAQADAVCRQVLAVRPREFHALHMLGIVALQLRDLANAERWFRAAIAANPVQPPAYSNLSAALLAQQRPLEALEHSERALRLKADFAEAWTNRANALGELQRTQESLASYDRGVLLAPSLFDAHFGRGKLLLRLQCYEQAVESYDRALRILPNHLEALNNRGIALLNLHRPEEALVMFERVLNLSPDFADALTNRGSALRRLRRPLDAIESYQQALRLQPDSPDVLSNMANVFLGLEMFDAALNCSDRALALNPALADALNIRATALRDLGRHDEAAGCYSQLVRVAPDFDYALGNRLFAQAFNCDWSTRSSQASSATGAVQAGRRGCLPFSFLSISDSAADQLQCARTFVADRYPPASALPRHHGHHHPRIRLAYLSADFHDHPVAHLLAGVLERHDRQNFETRGISLRREAHPGAMHARLRQAFEHFDDVSGVDDREVAAQLRQWEVDIAVDLSGFTRGGRLGILACRPAPVQVNYLGFAGSYGAPYIDYVIADPVVIPAGQEAHFSECIVRLPHSFLPNDDRQPIAGDLLRRSDVGLPDTGFVFCAFNNSYKINPPMFDIWMRLLRETPGSVLWLREGSAAMVANLSQEASARGVQRDRLIFAPRVAEMDRHLARYRLADLFLDTSPYGAHATSRDALWAGLPVLTCMGEAFASRVAASLLIALALPELVTGDLEGYYRTAQVLAHTPDRLAPLRQRLGQRRLAGPPFDTDLFRQHLESAYRSMWERYQRGEAPADIDLAVDR
jgi:predicted O-linked N-acetylglucosamine transferase (SPINDLY family)